MNPLRIGTRASALALWQAHTIADLLRPIVAPREVVLVRIETDGDRIQDRPLAHMGGFGVFTRAIQEALLADKADLAVHSLKDLPTIPVPGLMLAGTPERGPTADAFVSKRYATLAALPTGAVVATSSLRRRAQLAHHRPDLKLIDLRGNVDTRLRKLEEQQLDAIILAEAGLMRLGRGEAITQRLDEAWMLPAVGQGAIGLECRTDDASVRQAVEAITHLETWQAVRAERSMLAALGGGCLVPIGVRTVMNGTLTLTGTVLPPNGSERIDAIEQGNPSAPETLGERLAEKLLTAGAKRLLDSGIGIQPAPM